MCLYESLQTDTGLSEYHCDETYKMNQCLYVDSGYLTDSDFFDALADAAMDFVEGLIQMAVLAYCDATVPAACGMPPSLGGWEAIGCFAARTYTSYQSFRALTESIEFGSREPEVSNDDMAVCEQVLALKDDPAVGGSDTDFMDFSHLE